MSLDVIGLATSDLDALALALRSGRLAPPFTAMGLARYLPPNAPQSLAGELQRLCDQGWASSQIAILLDSLAADRRARGSFQDTVDLVTTGPTVEGLDNRDTSVVVRDLFASATTSVLVAGYAVHQGQQVFQALADRMQARPELRVHLILDIHRGPGDTSTAYELARRFAERFRTQQWPSGRPLPQVFYDPRSIDLPSGKRSAMHAKCIVVDNQRVFISSANFTEAAQERNIELGLLLDNPFLGKRTAQFFERMISASVLQPLPTHPSANNPNRG